MLNKIFNFVQSRKCQQVVAKQVVAKQTIRATILVDIDSVKEDIKHLRISFSRSSTASQKPTTCRKCMIYPQ
jgi:hypothetical protein